MKVVKQHNYRKPTDKEKQLILMDNKIKEKKIKNRKVIAGTFFIILVVTIVFSIILSISGDREFDIAETVIISFVAVILFFPFHSAGEEYKRIKAKIAQIENGNIKVLDCTAISVISFRKTPNGVNYYNADLMDMEGQMIEEHFEIDGISAQQIFNEKKQIECVLMKMEIENKGAEYKLYSTNLFEWLEKKM